ncbi:MAG: hydrogenase iron-sulfur subunit [candidate division WOR-3 bacterium]
MKIIAFFCQWCAYRGADLAGTLRLEYPHEIRIVKIPCTGGISPHILLKTFQMGADGILIGGCYPGECHYEHGNLIAEKRIKILKEILKKVGIEPERIEITWISAGEGIKMQKKACEFYEKIKKLGSLKK